MSIPRKLGKYELCGVVGTGAMGVVYKGIDPGIRRPVALKTIHRTLVREPEGADDITARFRNEAQAVGRLSHPGIVSIYEYGEDAGTHYIAMEWVDGRDLAQVLAADPLLPDDLVLGIMEQLLEALHHAHERGVWHRDIKPANLILTTTGQLKLTDFGVARIEGAGLTQVAAAIGTHGYMAPEQYAGRDFDQRVDIFAAGVLLYRLLTGRDAFSGPSPAAIMHKVLHCVPQAPSACMRAGRRLQLDAVVARAIAKGLAERYASARDFRDALRQAGALRATFTLGDGQTTIEADALLAQATCPLPSPPASTLDADAVRCLERTLTSFIGPLAKLLVKQAVSSHRDPDSLVQGLAAHVSGAGERERFIGLASGAIGARHSPTRELMPEFGQRPVSGQLISHATRVLTTRMGPIAGLLVSNAAAQAVDQAGFLDALLANSAAGGERDRLLCELKAGLERGQRPQRRR